MRDWFAAPDAEERVRAFTLEAAGLTVDYSKNRITSDTLALLQYCGGCAKFGHKKSQCPKNFCKTCLGCSKTCGSGGGKKCPYSKRFHWNKYTDKDEHVFDH